jgi:hypothetical protein
MHIDRFTKPILLLSFQEQSRNFRRELIPLELTIEIVENEPPEV